jgi:Domain of unknown function (DUF4389)
VVLVFLWIAALVVVVIIAWFAILFTGRYRRDMFGFVAGVIRWQNRVAAYAFLLVTDCSGSEPERRAPHVPQRSENGPIATWATRKADPAVICPGVPRRRAPCR